MKLIALMAVTLLATAAHAQNRNYTNDPVLANASPINVGRHTLGSGTPGQYGYEVAIPILKTAAYSDSLAGTIYHEPHYMPHFPTAATIWPRVIEIKCTFDRFCEGYNYSPAMGRGEYLFVTPRVVRAPLPTPPVIVERIVTVPGPERIILKEVPIKPKKE